ncbi:hypothetical protein G6F56_004759 [Rhizopus delemar]|nr:hypothetical protein G6F56_004759 [Rhizopus delemar]
MSDELNQNTKKNDSVKPSRKFRWSSCFSFVSNKLKRNSKLSTSKSFESFRPPPPVQKKEEKKPIKAEPSADILPTTWEPPALSPPPRQPKVKREPTPSNTRKDRIPLMDPTLTPRVRPRGQPSLLRLSLDAECLEDGSSLSTRSSLRCGSTKRTSDASIPIRWTHSSFESPLNDSFIQIDEEESGLTLKERRQRKSPLSLPDNLTLNLEEDCLDKSLLFQDKSRQEAMMILEGRPIASTRELDRHFNEPEMPTISENQDSIIPEIQQFAPSLISVPSSPNSLDSSVMEHDDYVTQQHALTVFLASN